MIEDKSADKFAAADKDYRVNAGLAEMLKGGVIMDVTTADQAKIAEDAGARAGLHRRFPPPLVRN